MMNGEFSGEFETTLVGGFRTARVTRKQLAKLMVEDCSGRQPDALPKLVFSSNGQGVALAGQDALFAKAMSEADIIHADGMSVVIASRILTKAPLPERVATTDFFEEAVQEAIRGNLAFFFLGGTESQNAAVVQVVHDQFPELKIAGRRNGYFREEDEAEICRIIRESRADVLWVALGKPLQEMWSMRNRNNLAGIGWIKTCGGLFGHLIGDEKRAPRWMQKLGFEWLYRVWRDPRRLWWRYMVTNPQSMWQLLRRSG